MKPALLLAGGTSETAPLAQIALDVGFDVLVSMATDAPLELPNQARRRSGRLSAVEMAALARREKIQLILDAGHPFALELHRTLKEAARLAGLPCLRFARKGLVSPQEVLSASNHEEAAALAFQFGGPVLLTTGSRHLECYVQAARNTHQRLFARVLDHPESLEACRAAGLNPQEIIAQRGPFSLEDNLKLLSDTQAKVLVTKDSGDSGGVGTKMEAARQKGIAVVMVRRPDAPGLNQAEFDTFDALRHALAAICKRSTSIGPES